MRPAGRIRRVLASDLVDRLFTPHGIDRHLEVLDPTWTVREARGKVVAVDRPTARAVTLTIRPNAAWSGFRAGQHVLVGVEIDGVVHHRTFSLAGSPLDPSGTIELTIRANPSGRVGRHLHAHARVGDVLRLSDAEGDMVLPETGSRPGQILFVSGGSGITPNISMLRALVDEAHDGHVGVLHYERSPEDLCYRDELRGRVGRLSSGEVAFGFTGAPGAGDLDGHLDADHVERVGIDLSAVRPDGDPDLAVYLCGPAKMLDEVPAILENLAPGVTIRTERFGTAPISDGILGGAGTVEFTRSGVEAPATGTILESAEAAGLEPAFGCRRGVCGTCTTRKTAGAVHHLLTGAVSDTDDGSIRPCVSVPVGDVAVDL